MPYEKLKALTRGRTVTLDDFATFIDGLEVSPKIKERLKKLRPRNYTGLSLQLAKSR
jgi:adenylosuccinate lyase